MFVLFGNVVLIDTRENESERVQRRMLGAAPAVAVVVHSLTTHHRSTTNQKTKNPVWISLFHCSFFFSSRQYLATL